MSNLLKRGSTIAKEERVIDYNEIIKVKLASIAESNEKNTRVPDEDGFIHGLDAEVVEQLVGDADSEDSAEAYSPEQAAAKVAEANEEADKIIADANEQAESILSDAKIGAQDVYNNASSQGYEAGIAKADAEIEESRHQLEAQYSDRLNQLEAEYAQKMAEVEPQLVDVMSEVFRSVITSEAVENKDILMHLIDTALSGAERNQEYIIKVSPADYDYVSTNQGKISCHVDRGIEIEIQEEASFVPNQCVIETDGTVFDCSLDVEMDNLIKKIKMLSCM